MNKDKILAELNQILLVTQIMQDKADVELWDDIAELELKRQRIIDSVFPIDSPDPHFRHVIEKIVSINNKVEDQCRESKNILQQQLSNMNKNKQAMTAYLIP